MNENELMIDLSTVKSIKEFHIYIAEVLDFPSFYGQNWDAFWDSITGFVELPKVIVFKNSDKFKEIFPKDFKILKSTFEEDLKEYCPWIKVEVHWE